LSDTSLEVNALGTRKKNNNQKAQRTTSKNSANPVGFYPTSLFKMS
jgi:hypothetical protein